MFFKVEHDFSFYDTVIDILEDYGWYILFSLIIIIYIISLLRPQIEKYLQRKRDRDYAAKYHKDPDLLIQRLEAQTNRTTRLQEQYEKDIEKYQEKQKENEAKKLDAFKKKYENTEVGTRLGSSENGSGKSLKPDYQPLMGDSSRSYRATRKSPCSGGGCGR